MMGSTNIVCYFVLEMFVMMGIVMFDFYILSNFLYCILLLDKNYRQYLVIYIILIYIR